jgi:hypothetical protein
VPSYLVETYLPLSPHALEDASEQARRVADLATGTGLAVRYIRTTLLGADETCFHAFDATSLGDLETALAAAGLVVDRIVQSDETSAEPASKPTSTEGVGT